MTLIIARKESNSIWMVADTIVTNPFASTRSRRYEMKIRRIGRGLVAFAGTFDTALAAIATLSETDSIDTINAKLAQCCRQDVNAEFAYGVVESDKPRLFKITSRFCSEIPSLFLGDNAEFSRFRYLNEQLVPPARPNTYHSLTLLGAEQSRRPSAALQKALTSMLSLFSGSDDKGVGGWAIPYCANSEQAYLVCYEYRVSDALPGLLLPQEMVPPPTVGGGGTILNLFSLFDEESVIARWRPSDIYIAFLKNYQGYETVHLSKDPARFASLVIGKASPESIQRIQSKWKERELGRIAITDHEGKVTGHVIIHEEGFDIEPGDVGGLPFYGSALGFGRS